MRTRSSLKNLFTRELERVFTSKQCRGTIIRFAPYCDFAFIRKKLTNIEYQTKQEFLDDLKSMMQSVNSKPEMIKHNRYLPPEFISNIISSCEQILNNSKIISQFETGESLPELKPIALSSSSTENTETIPQPEIILKKKQKSSPNKSNRKDITIVTETQKPVTNTTDTEINRIQEFQNLLQTSPIIELDHIKILAWGNCSNKSQFFWSKKSKDQIPFPVGYKCISEKPLRTPVIASIEQHENSLIFQVSLVKDSKYLKFSETSFKKLSEVLKKELNQGKSTIAEELFGYKSKKIIQNLQKLAKEGSLPTPIDTASTSTMEIQKKRKQSEMSTSNEDKEQSSTTKEEPKSKKFKPTSIKIQPITSIIQQNESIKSASTQQPASSLEQKVEEEKPILKAVESPTIVKSEELFDNDMMDAEGLDILNELIPDEDGSEVEPAVIIVNNSNQFNSILRTPERRRRQDLSRVQFSPEIMSIKTEVLCPICSRAFSKYQIQQHLQMKHAEDMNQIRKRKILLQQVEKQVEKIEKERKKEELAFMRNLAAERRKTE